MHLKDYIIKHYGGNQAAFGRAQGVARSHVQQWLNAGYIVIDNKMYSPRRELKTEAQTNA